MKLQQSPLFEPVLWEGRGFKILDETLLPEQIVYMPINAVAQAIDAVRDMKTRAFGQVLTFLYSGGLLCQQIEANDPAYLRNQINEMTQQFSAARPTFDFKILESFFSKWVADLPPNVHAGEWVAAQAREMGAQIVKARLGRAQRTASLLPDPAQVLTHCNVSGELVAVARLCREMGKEISFIATETRPYLQGARLTAWELAQAGAAVSLIPDCGVAQVMADGKVNVVVVGSDRCAQNGDVINKVGTYPLALMAKAYGIPFHVLVQDPGRLVQGDNVTIEERPAVELLEFQGQQTVSGKTQDLNSRYPAFDVTPAFLVSSLIGFDDVYTPESFRKKYLKVPIAGIQTGKKQPTGRYLLIYGLPGKKNYEFLNHALKAEQAQSVLVPEMRPELWGARVVVRELLDRKIPTTLISDNMMGSLFAQGEIRKLCLFYEDLSERGPRGICGSLLAVGLARYHGAPIELLASEPADGAIVDRDVSTFLGQNICPAGVDVYPVDSEVVPWAEFSKNEGGTP